MNESNEKNPDTQDKEKVTLDLDFAPSWARVSPEEQAQNIRRVQFTSEYDDEGYDSRQRSSGRKPYRERRPRSEFDGRSGRRPGPERERRPRSPERERDSFARSSAPSHQQTEYHQPHATHQRDGAPNEFRPRRTRRDYQRQPIPKLPLDIRVLPEQTTLGSVIRKIQSSHRAFPLRDLAGLFLDNPSSCLVRLERQRDSDEPIQLYQCKVCSMPGLNEEEIISHLITAHMGDFFDVEEVDCEPPSGAFVCVARCTLSGELLGPPNHHSFNTRLHELLSQRYPHMSEESYRKRIEMVRDAEVVESWRQQCTRKNIYRLKGAGETMPLEEEESSAVVAEEQPEVEQPDDTTSTPATDSGTEAETAAVETTIDATAESLSEESATPGSTASETTTAEVEPPPKAPPLEREMAELVFKRDIVPGQVAQVRSLVCTVAVALQTPNHNLKLVLQDTLRRERRYPASLFFALRGAFRHRKLHLFRANDSRGADFVMFGKPVLLDSEQPVVDSWRNLLDTVAARPGITKAELVESIAGSDEEQRRKVLMDLVLLIEKGHIIEYFNTTLTMPDENPFFQLTEDKPADPPAQKAEKKADKEPEAAQEPEETTVADATEEATPDATLAEGEAPVAPEVEAVAEESESDA